MTGPVNPATLGLVEWVGIGAKVVHGALQVDRATNGHAVVRLAPAQTPLGRGLFRALAPKTRGIFQENFERP